MGRKRVTVFFFRIEKKENIQYPSTSRNEFNESLTLVDHTNFVSAVCVLDDGKWICTASNDATVCVYVAGNRIPFTVLKGHTSTGTSVCLLAKFFCFDCLCLIFHRQRF